MNVDDIKENVKIVDLARELGFTVIRVGNYYTLAEHDSVRIDPRKNVFIQNSTGRGGSVIDFTLTFTNLNLRETIKRLSSKVEASSSFSEYNKSKPIEKKPIYKQAKLEMPKKDNTYKNIFAYLISTRKLDGDIVSDMVKRKMLYQDTYKNCVFVSYKNNVPAFICKRGTNTYKRFVADVIGSDYNYGFYIDNKSNEVIITESVIDALSIMSLKKKQGEDYKAYNYLALAGVAKFENTIKYHFGNTRGMRRIYLALDNDKAGRGACEEIRSFLKELNFDGETKLMLPMEKDWNEQLLKEQLKD